MLTRCCCGAEAEAAAAVSEQSLPAQLDCARVKEKPSVFQDKEEVFYIDFSQQQPGLHVQFKQCQKLSGTWF